MAVFAARKHRIKSVVSCGHHVLFAMQATLLAWSTASPSYRVYSRIDSNQVESHE